MLRLLLVAALSSASGDVCEEDMAFLQVGRKGFDKAQLIGFSLNTFPANMGADANAQNLLKQVMPVLPMLEKIGIHVNITYDTVEEYLGLENAVDDVSKRFELMKLAVTEAYEQADFDPSESTLKVFMAPEFFFRGPKGAYEASSIYKCKATECQAPIHTLLELMSKFVADEKWKSWLFVFGTIVAAEMNPDPKTSEEAPVLYYNAAPVFLGASKEKFLVAKRWVSTIDYLQRCAGGDCVPKGAGLNAQVPEFAKEYLKKLGFVVVEDNIFHVGGVMIGLEVCLDHGAGMLYKNLKAEGKLPGGVQLQLITSAGMQLNYKIAPNLAPEFLQDGGNGQNTASATQPLPLQPFIDLSEPIMEKLGGDVFLKLFAIGKDEKGNDIPPKLNVFAPAALPPSPHF